MSAAEETLALHMRGIGLPHPKREYRFHTTRKWRFDFAWPELRLAVEVEGGVYSGGRHTRGKGFEADAEKYNEAALMGWTVIRVTPGMIKKGLAIDTISRAIQEAA